MDNNKEITIALLGPSRVGKTAFINSLGCEARSLMKLYVDYGARTKITVNYKFVSNIVKNNIDKEITWNYAKIACGGDFKNIEGYNKQVLSNKIYSKIGLKCIDAAEENMYANLVNQLNDISNNIKIDDVIELVNTEGIDKYICGITIITHANAELDLKLREYKATLVVRDTRGLLDMIVDDVDNNTKSVQIKPLVEWGLDGVNAVLFFGSESFPDSVAKLYKEMLSTVMNAVPTYYVRKISNTIEMEKNNFVVKRAKEITDTMRKASDDYDELFFDTFKFLEILGVVKQNGDNFEPVTFKNCDMREVQYVIPNCRYLFNIKKGGEIKELDSSYYSYSTFTNYIMIDVIDKLMNHYIQIFNVLKEDIIGNRLLANKDEFKKMVIEDFEKYDTGKTKYARPQVKYEDKESLSMKMVDKHAPILGKYDGITSLNGNKLRFVATAVAGVTMERALRKWIRKNRDNFKTLNLNTIDSNESEEMAKIVEKALLYILQKRFVDQNAVIQGYCCINRYDIAENIQIIRNNSIESDKAMGSYVELMFVSFCNELKAFKDSNNIEEGVWNLIVESGKTSFANN